VPTSGLTRGQRLHWRSQFAPEPARCFSRFHRIDQRDHALKNVIASGAFECSNVEAGRTGSDPCQHHHRFALGAWPVKRAHDDAVPYIRREHNTLSHRWMPLEGGDGNNLLPSRPDIMVNTDHFSKKLTKVNQDIGGQIRTVPLGYCKPGIGLIIRMGRHIGHRSKSSCSLPDGS
jgi:hypothetical protein